MTLAGARAFASRREAEEFCVELGGGWVAPADVVLPGAEESSRVYLEQSEGLHGRTTRRGWTDECRRIRIDGGEVRREAAGGAG